MHPKNILSFRPWATVLAASLAASLALPALAASAAPPLLDEYVSEARRGDAAFQASGERGQRLFASDHGVSRDLPKCTTCHGKDLTQPGKHAITGKQIAPLSPLAHASRFSERDKSDKWFRRNCSEVIGRACSAGEKADILQFALSGGRS